MSYVCLRLRSSGLAYLSHQLERNAHVTDVSATAAGCLLSTVSPAGVVSQMLPANNMLLIPAAKLTRLPIGLVQYYCQLQLRCSGLWMPLTKCINAAYVLQGVCTAGLLPLLEKST